MPDVSDGDLFSKIEFVVYLKHWNYSFQFQIFTILSFTWRKSTKNDHLWKFFFAWQPHQNLKNTEGYWLATMPRK